MTAPYIIGLLLNVFVFYLWKHRYIKTYEDEEWHRIKVPAFLMYFYIVVAFIPLLNIMICASHLAFILSGGMDAYYTKWEDFPKWITKYYE